MSQVDYPGFAWRWAMKKQEVILKAIAGEIKWIQAADILGVSARTIRRMKGSYQRFGINGLVDMRTGRPSNRRISYEIVEQVLNLFRQEYFDFNVAHFHEKLEQNHDIQVSYTWVNAINLTNGFIVLIVWFLHNSLISWVFTPGPNRFGCLHYDGYKLLNQFFYCTACSLK